MFLERLTQKTNDICLFNKKIVLIQAEPSRWSRHYSTLMVTWIFSFQVENNNDLQRSDPEGDIFIIFTIVTCGFTLKSNGMPSPKQNVTKCAESLQYELFC